MAEASATQVSALGASEAFREDTEEVAAPAGTGAGRRSINTTAVETTARAVT